MSICLNVVAFLFRRAVALRACCCVLVLAAALTAASAVRAGTPGEARLEAGHVLEQSITRILSLIENPDYVNPRTREPLRLQIEDEVYHCFDFAEFSARTVGQAWQTFTQEQRNAFTDAFAELLFSTYLSQIDGYNGEQVRYTGSRANDAGTRVEVSTELSMQDGRVIPIAYRMMPSKGTWVVYDVFVEGVSLVRSYRTQFQDILSRSTPDELTARVRERAREVDNAAQN